MICVIIVFSLLGCFVASVTPLISSVDPKQPSYGGTDNEVVITIDQSTRLRTVSLKATEASVDEKLSEDEYGHIAEFVDCDPFKPHLLSHISSTARNISVEVQKKRRKEKYDERVADFEQHFDCVFPQIEARTVDDIYAEIMKEIKKEHHNVNNHWKGITTETKVPFLVNILKLDGHAPSMCSQYFTIERNVIITILFDEAKLANRVNANFYDLRIDNLPFTNPCGQLSVKENVKPMMKDIGDASLFSNFKMERWQICGEDYTKRKKGLWNSDEHISNKQCRTRLITLEIIFVALFGACMLMITQNSHLQRVSIWILIIVGCIGLSLINFINARH